MITFSLNYLFWNFFFKSLHVVLVPAGKRVVCYYTNWSQYRPDGGKFFPENIDTNLCTHIIFAFAKIVDNSLVAIEWNDEDSEWSKGTILI